jgi:hypothetical protein
MADKAPSKVDQLRALREARAGGKRRPNPFEDAARGRDPAPRNTPEASGTARKAPSGEVVSTTVPMAKPSRNLVRASSNPVAKEPKASGHNRRADDPQGPRHRGSSRLSAGRTAQDRAESPKAGAVANSNRGQRGMISPEAARKPQGRQRGSTPSRLASLPSGPETGSAARIKRGRPKITAPRPWELEGMSRRSWYRRQAEKAGK